MEKKGVVRELIWIGVLLLISIIISRLIFGYVVGDAIDIALHDTYFVFPVDPITNALWIWVSLILVKYTLQGLILLAKQNIVAAVVMALIFLFGLVMTVLGAVISYSNLSATVPGGDPFTEHMQRINVFGFIFYLIISAGLLTLLMLIIKEIIVKTRLC